LSRSEKKRLDLLLLDLRPDLSRSRVQSEIMAGKVTVDGTVCDKPGTLLTCTSDIQLLEPKNPYVSRGGLKMAGALEDFSIVVKDLVVLDVGASTGGFTDCLLQNGAKLVYALDVGYGQFAYSLRNDPRVVVMERFNIRNLTAKDLAVKPDLSVIDVSFISLTKVLPVLAELSIESVLALIKPQFEAGRTEASKGSGVIRDPALHLKVLNDFYRFAAEKGYCCRGVTYSRWPGPKGNIEYFFHLVAITEGTKNCISDFTSTAVCTVETAHQKLL
jgi:23S rRNA (cytidine1920-2'-O)/16S rRNA (cytidine1409-2'-O)-methyltransferase